MASPYYRKAAQSIFGPSRLYRRFVSRFAKIARPLNTLMVGIPNDKKLGSRLAPGQLSAQTAFEALKQVLTQAPILAYADFTQAFIVYTDASHQGFGAVLAQIQEGKE